MTLASVACGGDERSVGVFGSAEGGVTSPTASGTGTGGSAGDDADASDGATSQDSGSLDDGVDGSDGGGPKLDVGAMETAEGGDEGSCLGDDCSCTSVDLLFIIDNSTSMNDYQVALGQAFPTFADAIIEALPPGTNLHVGITSTEMGYSNAGSTTNCVATGNGMPQENFYLTPDVMDSGKNGAQGRLYVAQGMPYFDIDTDAPAAEVQQLRDWFAAAANIGEGGSNVEMASAAAGWATDPANDAANAGFLRDEGSVLVLFFFQDEPDQSDAPGMTMPEVGQAMLDKIAAAKAGCGGLQCVVGGGFVQQSCMSENALGVLLNGLDQPPALGELPFDDENVDPAYFVPLLKDTLAQVIAQTCDEIGPEG